MSENPTRIDLNLVWNPLEPHQGEDILRKLLPEGAQGDGDENVDPFYRIDLLTQIARAQGLQGKISDANMTLEVASALLEKNKEELQSPSQANDAIRSKIRIGLEKGRIFVLARTPSQARNHFLEAWALARQTREDCLAVDSAQMMAGIEPKKLQEEWILKAIRVAEESPQKQSQALLIQLHSVIGWKRFEARQFDSALGIFQKVLSLCEAQENQRERFIARWAVGVVLRALHRTDEALAIQQGLVAELRSKKITTGLQEGRVYEELAECLQTLKKPEEAQPFFELAYRELSQHEWINDNQPVLIKRMKELGKVK